MRIVKQVFFLFLLGSGLTITPSFAQVSEEAKEQKEFSVQDRREVLLKKPETAEEILKMLKERAEIKIKEKRRALLLKTKFAMGLKGGFESNPLNDAEEKSDFFVEEEFTANWLPTFNEWLGADLGYRLTNQGYAEQTDLSTFDNDASFSLKYTPFESGEIILQPGGEYEWLNYPLDESATYEDTKGFLKFKHYIGANWNYGGKYEYSYKVYHTKLARDEAKNSLSEIERMDYRNTVELYATKYISKYSVRLKGKAYKNNSNDLYQNFYDYYSYRGYVTLSGSFMKDKLYLTFTPDFERKNYLDRAAEDGARADKVLQYKFDAYYTLNKNLELSYNFTNKNSVSNDPSGEFLNITNSLGMTCRF